MIQRTSAEAEAPVEYGACVVPPVARGMGMNRSPFCEVPPLERGRSMVAAWSQALFTCSSAAAAGVIVLRSIGLRRRSATAGTGGAAASAPIPNGERSILNNRILAAQTLSRNAWRRRGFLALNESGR
jgi:hypothetical protein